MDLVICGQSGVGKSEITDLIRQYYAKKGTPVFAVDCLLPVYQMHDAAMMGGRSVGVPQPQDGKRDYDLLVSLSDWLAKKSPTFLSDYAKNHTSRVTRTWRDSGFFHIVIYDGMRLKANIDSFEKAAKVLLVNSQAVEWDGELENFDSSKFDLVLDAGRLPKEEMVAQIADYIFQKVEGSLG